MEERSLTGLCGYPLCDKQKPSISNKGKYHISLKDKKVYDLEERKNTFDISYINFEAKMNFSISHHIIHEGIKKMPKRFLRGVSKNGKDS